MNKYRATAAALALLASMHASAQQPAAAAGLGTPRAIVDATIVKLKDLYVFPDVAAKVEAVLKKTPRSDKAIADAGEAKAFAQQLTDELQAVTHDKHLRVRYSDTALPQRTVATPTAEEEARMHEQMERGNFGVERVERLPGNIGYIDLRGFAPLQWSGEKITAAMTLVANTDALIVDLRKNGGGDPATVAFMSSYLFDERTHLNDLYFREGERTEQFHTLDWVPGRRFGQKKPVYVLTSARTFSGAEEFSYNLKNLKRATLVGETTGGGANPGDVYPLNAHFAVFVPTGRAVNPVTHTNWEGTGVSPDVKVAADDAFAAARALALKALADKETASERKAQLQQLLAEDPAARK
jgi:C-terminal processing protease CtpA/Prc